MELFETVPAYVMANILTKNKQSHAGKKRSLFLKKLRRHFLNSFDDSEVLG